MENNFELSTITEAFVEWIGRNEYTFFIDSWFDKDNHSLDCNTKELFSKFLENYKNGK